MSGLSLKSKLLVRLLNFTKHGTLQIAFPDGSLETLGQGEPLIQVTAKDWKVIDDIYSKGDLGFAEAVIDGNLIVNDMAALIEWACKNEQSITGLIHGTWYGTMIDRLRKLFTLNSRKGAQRNIMAHYDLGNDFYKLWLDETMTYSSGIYQSSVLTLTQAQHAKYDRIIDALDIKPTDHILEIGCGWGGFFSRAVERTGCKVTAVMNSPAQAQFNRNLIEQKGLAQNVDLRQMDYRDIEGRFDKIVSIEMIEAVGEQYWGSFFGKVSASLKAGGQAMIQSITIDDGYFENYRKQTDFIQRYVFPGGMLLAPQVFNAFGAKNNMNLDAPFEFGLSYAQTLRQWLENFIAVEGQVRAMGFDERFLRLWKLYLEYCEGAFRAQRINVGHYQFMNAR